jgi:hypothetical protein
VELGVRILHKIVLIISDFPAYLHMEGSTFAVDPPYVGTVKSGHFQLLSWHITEKDVH